ncbi:hypothetical protein [Leucobacter luti]|uniref:hypothetical protein n=1 Tax=Leucobacter luti TaxID=340320 RepID=UPI003D0268C3
MIDALQYSNIVVSALALALANRQLSPGEVLRVDDDVQFNAGAFTNQIREAGQRSSFWADGNWLDQALMESI